jgi:hypothetical protein
MHLLTSTDAALCTCSRHCSLAAVETIDPTVERLLTLLSRAKLGWLLSWLPPVTVECNMSMKKRWSDTDK